MDAVLIAAAASEATELVGDEAGTGATGPVVAVADVEAGEVVPDVVSGGVGECTGEKKDTDYCTADPGDRFLPATPARRL